MQKNVQQINTYLREYCRETGVSWCIDTLKSFEDEMSIIDLAQDYSDEELAQQIVLMNDFLNEKYE